MKKVMAILMGVLLAGSFTIAKAEVLSDSQLAGISAGDFNTDITDDVRATNSAVVSQKNIGVVSSTDGAITNASISNRNDTSGSEGTGIVANIGVSAVALQANIAAMASLGADVSSGNKITNENKTTVDNLISDEGSTELTTDDSTNSGEVGINSLFGTVIADQSAVASQNNIGAIAGAGGVSAGAITNTNTANVTNNSLL